MTVRDLTILGCASQQPTRLRNHGAYLLRWNEEGFLFDPGEGTQRQFIFADIAFCGFWLKFQNPAIFNPNIFGRGKFNFIANPNVDEVRLRPSLHRLR